MTGEGAGDRRSAEVAQELEPGEGDALVAWSALAEPGDRIAQWLVGTVGAKEALQWWKESVQSNGRVALPASVEPRDRERIERAVERWEARRERSEPGRLREQASACGARVIERGAPGWPRALADLGQQQPYVLWVRGDADLKASFDAGVAVVGARAATAYGEHMTAEVAAGIADGRRAVISGGAYGIDARAHRAALAAGGRTVAVLAGGVDRLYPAGNADLLAAIVRGGALVSEFPPGSAPHRSRFLERNRLIATAAATVVVEAAVRSGALSTARHALDLARPVAAIPGPATSPSSAGCHRLIRDQQAVLCTSARDVLELVEPIEQVLELDLGLNAGPPGGIEFAHAHDRKAYDAIGARGSAVEDVMKDAGLTTQEALMSLGRLEMAGMASHAGGLWRRAAPAGATPSIAIKRQ
ncbi:DNA-processing protein DprA [Demequina globuliformis]|uniref:DNA-processing protein DprA n=1 Tax=Demequina globuliformis TaxID=676202 RepID=UPI0007803E48|nr:DNA-processing protein DprA [Demequina globuliformis]